MRSKTFVPPSGPLTATIAIVGEQPGRNEAFYSHQPFTGPAGKNLDECLGAAGINRSECWLTNVIKDFDGPLSDYITFSTTKKVTQGIFTPKGLDYAASLKEELDILRPNIVVVCGNIALWALTSRVGITNWRGSILSSTLVPELKVVPTFHPATWTEDKLRRNPEAFLNKYCVILDLRKAKQESAYPEIRLKDRATKIKPLYPEVLEFLNKCHDASDRGATLDYDIELVPGTQEISCISFAFSPTESMCIPFIDGNGDYFGLEHETKIMLEIAKILEDEKIKKGGQYIIFDSHLMLRKYGIVARNLEDTFIAQKILFPELPAGLDFITSMWADMPYYKRDGKIWLGGIGTWEQGWIYNCKDSLSCAEARPKQLAALAEAGNIAAYERQRKLIEPLTYMMEHGILVDLEGMKKERQENEGRIVRLTHTAYQGMGHEINLASPKQLCEYFYGEKRIKPYLSSKTGKPTVDITALKRLASTHGLHEASTILEIRKLEKLNSTFLDPEKLDPDGRIRCAYNPAGTKFSRISSTANIFGTGINLQNVPHSALSYLKVDRGYCLYELDLSQYENRIVAYVGNIVPMIEVFESGLDSHKMTAALVLSAMGYPTHYYEVTGEQRQEYGKTPNHAFNYGLGPNSFALLHELPQTTGKKIYNAYHTAYPGLRGGYWGYVQQGLRVDRTLINLLDRKVTFMGKWGESLLQSAYSYIPQSTCGDVINERGVIFTYYNSDPLFRHVRLLTQVHDSIAIEIPLALGAENHARILIRIREELEIPLEFRGREFRTPVDLVVNDCLNKEMGVELKGKEFSNDPRVLAGQLEKAWERLYLVHSSQ